MRTNFKNSEVQGDSWEDLKNRCFHPVDHFHGVINMDGEKHLVHIACDDKEVFASGTIWKEVGEWEPEDFDTVSCDD